MTAADCLAHAPSGDLIVVVVILGVLLLLLAEQLLDRLGKYFTGERLPWHAFLPMLVVVVILLPVLVELLGSGSSPKQDSGINSAASEELNLK